MTILSLCSLKEFFFIKIYIDLSSSINIKIQITHRLICDSILFIIILLEDYNSFYLSIIAIIVHWLILFQNSKSK